MKMDKCIIFILGLMIPAYMCGDTWLIIKYIMNVVGKV